MAELTAHKVERVGIGAEGQEGGENGEEVGGTHYERREWVVGSVPLSWIWGVGDGYG